MVFKMVVKSTVSLRFWRHKAQDMNRLSDLVWTNHFATDSVPLDPLVRPHLSWQGNTMPLSQLSALPSPRLFIFVPVNRPSCHSPFFSPQAKILGKVLCLHAEEQRRRQDDRGRKFLSSRSNILEVGCQGAWEIWSFRDEWKKHSDNKTECRRGRFICSGQIPSFFPSFLS